MVAICATVGVWTSVKNRLELEREMELRERGVLIADEWASVDIIISRINMLHDLVSRIKAAIVCDNIMQEGEIVSNPADEVTESSTVHGPPSNKSSQRRSIGLSGQSARLPFL